MAGQILLLWRSREVFLQWTWREIRAQYSQTAAGVGWAVLQPVASALILTVVFGVLTRFHPDRSALPIFYFAAVLPWTFFQTSLLQAVPSLQKQMHILSKIYFPREVVPFAVITARGLDFLLGFGFYAFLAIWYGLPMTKHLLWIPLLLGLQILFTAGVVLLLSAINVFIRDLAIILPWLAQIWLFLTPIIYSVEDVPERFRSVLLLNPMAPLIEGYRRVLVNGSPPDWDTLAVGGAISFLLLVGAYAIFKRLEPRMADVG